MTHYDGMQINTTIMENKTAVPSNMKGQPCDPTIPRLSLSRGTREQYVGDACILKFI